MSKLWTLIIIVVGVSAVSVLLGWMSFRLMRHMDRVEREPKYKRHWLYYGAALYGFGLVTGVTRVLSGDLPPVALLGVLIPLLIVWVLLREAKRVKIPPDQ